MNIWIITTGSSDVQLKTENNWNSLHSKARNQLETQKQFSSSKSKDGKRFLYPARAMGIVYGSAIANDSKHNEDLDFPLLDNFFWLLDGQEDSTEKIIIDRIIVIVTDQSETFKGSKRNDPLSSYWQDTCTLQPILEKYLKEKSGKEPEFLPLAPDPKKSGLDNWNDVLERVEEKFKEKFADLEDISKDTTIYVSHQAGTPAISSAVQFSSLAQFGDRVRFLVSSEQNTKSPEILPSSSYLKSIRKQEANILLGRPDYPGIQILLEEFLKDDDTQVLLSSAIQWNSAEFEKFSAQFKNDNLLKRYPELVKDIQVRTKEENWWWIAYEEAYLALIRQNQDNIVEAFFHSFRAFEGIFSAWVNHEFGANNHVEIKKGMLYLKCSVLSDPKGYFSKAKFKPNGKPNDDLAKLKCKIEKDNGVELDLATICKLFRSCRSEYKQECGDLKIFWDSDPEKGISEKRNRLVHQIQGMSKKELWGLWGVLTPEDWETRIREFLNFIAKQDFLSLQQASLMAKVHRKLVSAIAAL